MKNDCSTCKYMYLDGYNNEFQMCDEYMCHYEMKRGKRAGLEVYDDWSDSMSEYRVGKETLEDPIDKLK